MIERHVPDYLQVPKPDQIDIAIQEIVRLAFSDDELDDYKSKQRTRLRKLAK